MRRRPVLLALGGLLVGGVSLWAMSRFGRRTPVAGVTEGPAHVGGSSEIFPASEHPLLLAVADVIVPRSGDSPSASEIELLPRLDRTLALSEDGTAFFRTHWSDFAGAIHARVPGDAVPDPGAMLAVFESWYLEARRGSPSLEARYFEGLRRAVLLAYYSSPEGWRAAGYPGPVHRAHPAGAVPD